MFRIFAKCREVERVSTKLRNSMKIALNFNNHESTEINQIHYFTKSHNAVRVHCLEYQTAPKSKKNVVALGL